MKQNKIVNLLTLLIFTTPLFAAPSGIYLEAGIANSLTDSVHTAHGGVSYNSNISTTFSLGYQADLYRYELEGIFTKGSLSSFGSYSAEGDFTKESKMLNLYYSGYNHSRMISSVGAGVGMSDIALKNMTQLGQSVPNLIDNNILSVQGMMSLGYMMSPRFITTIKYTYFYTKSSSNFSANGDNLFTFSLRYIF